MKLRLGPANGTPLYRRIEEAVRAAIRGRQLAPGDQLPSVAELAKDFSINKLTVGKAYRHLEQEGLLRSEVGRGTFVASDVKPAAAPEAEPRPEVTRSLRRIREGYARGLRELLSMERPAGAINLAGGVPSPATIPDGLLEKLSLDVIRKNARRLYEYGGPAGLPELRQELAELLTRRGIPATPDELIITNGSQQAASLAAAWAKEDGRTILCETPTYTGIPGAFMLFGQAVQSIAWNDEGPSLDQVRAAATGRRVLLYTCADFNNPTGRTMTTAARHDLAEWARRTDGFVIDDAIFREMRFEGEAPPALYTLLPPGRRILIGSLSKCFMTGLRVGYLLADRSLIPELLPYKRYMDLGGPAIVQAVAAAFLRNGYTKHLEKMRTYHKVRRDAAIDALQEFMPDDVTWTKPEGGFQMWVTLPAGLSSVQLYLQAVERGVVIAPGPAHDIDGRYLNSFRLGYGHGTPAEIRTGIRKLGDIVRELLARGSSETSASGLGIVV